MIFNQTVTVLTAPAGTRDQQGNFVRDWDNAVATDYAGVAVTPFSSTEADLSSLPRDQVFTGYKISTRRGMNMVVEAIDRVRWAGSVWSVAATPERWPHPVSNRAGAVHHVEVIIQRVTG